MTCVARVVDVCVLPGTGKSKLAQALHECARFEVIRSDDVRKELADIPRDEPSPQQVRESIYTPDWNIRTYAECLSRAESLLHEGKRIIVGATFREDKHRQAFLNMAIRSCVPVLFIVCEARAETIQQRLCERHGDAFDADYEVYLHVKSNWEKPGVDVGGVLHTVSTENSAEETLNQALDILQQVKLLDGTVLVPGTDARTSKR